MQLRTYVMVDRMQPQYAAFTGKRTLGMIPVEGDAQIFIEISPAAEVYKVMDIALKTTDVKPGYLSMGRQYGFLEIHSGHQEAVQYTGQKVLESMGLNETDRLKPRVLSANMTSGIDPYEAQLINARNAGGLVLARQTFCVIEVVPAAYIVLAANEAEKAARITLNHYSQAGANGRLMISGSESAVSQSRDAAISAFEALEGRTPG
ncbi:MAG: BMC domain-containing protein [Chloroflexi bacterium]|jgi:ethanolamine utilization microcompartment shell protein EutL|nr:BMC domain-containing protein [Chloroflexota bacterium]